MWRNEWLKPGMVFETHDERLVELIKPTMIDPSLWEVFSVVGKGEKVDHGALVRVSELKELVI